MRGVQSVDAVLGERRCRGGAVQQQIGVAAVVVDDGVVGDGEVRAGVALPLLAVSQNRRVLGVRPLLDQVAGNRCVPAIGQIDAVARGAVVVENARVGDHGVGGST